MAEKDAERYTTFPPPVITPRLYCRWPHTLKPPSWLMLPLDY